MDQRLQIRHSLSCCRRWPEPLARNPHYTIGTARPHVVLEFYSQASARVSYLNAGAGNRDDRRIRRNGHVPVLPLLGGNAHPNVLPDWSLGRRTSYLRGG